MQLPPSRWTAHEHDEHEIESPLKIRACGLYVPGHDVHWIQVKQSGMDHSTPRRSGRLVDIRDDGEMVGVFGEETLHLWNHDPGRLRAIASLADGEQAELHQRWSILRLPSSSGSYCFSVTTPEDHRVCADEPPQGSPLELLQSAGGFIISGQDALRAIDVVSDPPSS